MTFADTPRMDALEWIRQRKGNYLHICYEPYEGKEAETLIRNLLDAGALKVEVTKERGYSDDEDEREQLYITLPDCIPRQLLLEILHLDSTEHDLLDEEPNVLRLWWDNH
ncbi:MAG: hypothetical protein ACTSSA_12585 [Candidatus Freyarchaeota archaeon]